MNGTDLIQHAIDTYQPSDVLALFSGGHDSLVASHIAMQSGLASRVLHIDTGIGIHATQQYVVETCERTGWPLWIVRAKEDCGQDYEELVMRWGMPGPDGHGLMYQRLKARALRHASRNSGGNPLFVSGRRSEESSRRMRTTMPHEASTDPKAAWVCPCWDYSDEHQRAYMIEHDLPRNPVKDKMCMSGECLCGAFGHPNELREWNHFYGDDPGLQNLMRIRDRVLERFPWDWGSGGPPKWWQEANRGQQIMFDMTPDHEQFLCVNCHKRDDANQDADAMKGKP